MSKLHFFKGFHSLNIALLLSSVYLPSLTAQNYCASKGNAPWNEWIAGVQIGTINNASVKEGYGNFTNVSANLVKGMTYPLMIKQGFSWAGDPANATQQGRVWMDFNQNGTFEATELVASLTRNSLTANVLIPNTALTGATRMRVSLKTVGVPTACEVFEKGEVEDYTINIQGGSTGGNLPDLTLSNLTISNPSVPQGQILNWKVDIKNIGTGNAASNFSVKAYLSTDNMLSTNDIQDGIIPTANFAAGFSSLQVPSASTIATTIPAGQYYLILKVDPDNQVTESNENNNILVSTSTFTVTTNSTIDCSKNVFNGLNNILFGKKVIARAGGVTYPIWANANDANDFNTTTNECIGRWGENTSGSFQTIDMVQTYNLSGIGYYFDWDGAYNNPITIKVETSLDNYNWTTVYEKVHPYFTPVSGSPNYNLNASIPTTSARYIRFSFPYDGAWNGWGDIFHLRAFGTPVLNGLPDLTLANLTIPVTSVQRGQILNFKTDIQNISSVGATGNFTIKSYLSTDNVWSANDYQDGIIPTANFAAGQLVTQVAGAMTVNNTVPTGQYYLILKVDADNAIAENNENNNVIVSAGLVTVVSVLPDLRITNIVPAGTDWTTTTFKGGDVTGLSVTVVGGSATVPGPLLTTFYLSLDTLLDAQDASWTTWTTGTNETFAAGGTIPNLADGDYYVLAKVNSNNAIAESNIQNNIFVMKAPKMKVRNATASNDIILSIVATPGAYTKYAPLNFTIAAQNNDNQPFTNVKIDFKFPANTTNGGTVTPSLGNWQEWCANGVQCFTWTIPTLAAHTTATLNVPIYVLNAASMVATARLLASTPTDAVVTNNIATVNLSPATAIAARTQVQPTIIVQQIAPNPADKEVVMSLESLESRDVQFDFLNTMGSIVFSEKRTVQKGANRLLFDVSQLPKGIYFVATTTQQGDIPMKFVKM